MKKLKVVSLLIIVLILFSPLSLIASAKIYDNQGNQFGKEKPKNNQNNDNKKTIEKYSNGNNIKTKTSGSENSGNKSPVEHFYLYEKDAFSGEIIENAWGKVIALTHINKIILNIHHLETFSLSLIDILSNSFSDERAYDNQLVHDSWLSNWSYRKSHTILGSTAGYQTNYQIPIQVNFGEGYDQGSVVYLNMKCRPDFGDIRFTSSDAITELDYWIEEYVIGEKALVWVEVSQIPESPEETSIYIYYGCESASTTSNGEETFLLFSQDGLNGWTKEAGDDWETVEIDEPYGTVISSPAVDDDYDSIYQDFEPTQGFRYAVDTFFGISAYGSWRYSYKVNIFNKNTGSYDDAVHLFYRVDDGTYKMDRIIYAYENGVNEYSPPTTETDPEYPYPKQWFTITLEVDGNNIRVYDDDTIMENIYWDNDVEFSRIRLISRREKRYEDNHRIMKLCNPEPEQTTWGSEESIPTSSNDIDLLLKLKKDSIYEDINFKVTNIKLLTISKNKEEYQGFLENTDGSTFKFIISVTKGDIEKTYHFFIKIWDLENTDNPVFQYQKKLSN
jgi:hypothetical protein